MQRRENGFAAIDREADDHGHHDQRENDQIVADLQHGLLEMTDRDRRLDQFRRLAEIGLAAGRIDQRVDLAATNDRAGEHRVAGFACRRQRLAGQRRLIDRDFVAVQQTRVGGNDVAQTQADRVAGNQLLRGGVDSIFRRASPAP